MSLLEKVYTEEHRIFRDSLKKYLEKMSSPMWKNGKKRESCLGRHGKISAIRAFYAPGFLKSMEDPVWVSNIPSSS